ncbi:phage/plasmid primase, P4 family [Pyramidobacter piscolens]|uniref:phage/plasmid primase, P4 family n=1 Tax=Pyramidobacter piscolens TaxID=638849 RepID=UPI0028E834B3|nr:phage/plasmid primase, P4 family [Pyramidobacter piscolens]
MRIEELKEMRIWVCFTLIEKNGRTEKNPISAYGTETGSDAAHAHSWVTYDEAVRAMNEKGYDAVGFALPDNMFFLDMDHMGVNDPFVQIRLDRLNTYAESSVSGTGIHAYGLMDGGRIPTCEKDGKRKLDKAFYQKNPNNNMELYFGAITNRFAVFTGKIIRDADIIDCTDAVLLTLDKDMRRKDKQKYSEKRDGGDKEVFDIVASLMKQKNGEKFRRLYNDGDYSEYGSQSEADCALCAMIAFRTGADPQMIDTVFRSSALMRDKWNRDDYRESTIEKGIEACHGTFHKSKMEHPDFIRFNKQTGEPYVVVPLLAEHTRKNLRYLLVRDSGKQGLLKYVYEDGVYRLYADDMFKGCIKKFIEDYDPEIVKIGQVSEAYQHIITDLNYVGQDELNADETLVNFKNCLLRVTADSLTLVPHTPNVYSTIQIPCCWTGKPSPTPVFDSYMNTLTNGDAAVTELLLEVIGLVISNIKAWRTKRSLFMKGPGDSGKSVIKTLTEMFVGKGNFIGIDLKEIEARFGTGAIYGTRLAGSSDMSFLTVDELKTFKKITGGDSLFAEFKGQQAFEFTYNGFLWFCMNRLPKFGGDDGEWVYNRIMVVDCPNAIPRDKQDTRLIDKLYAEREGIIFKAVRALQQVIRNGYRFTEPESVTAARAAYQSDNSTVISFFNECMCERPSNKIEDSCTTGKVYKVYKAWCADNNNGYAKTYKEFRDQLADYLGTTFYKMIAKRHTGTFYRAYTLDTEIKKQYAQVYGYDDFSLH